LSLHHFYRISAAHFSALDAVNEVTVISKAFHQKLG